MIITLSIIVMLIITTLLMTFIPYSFKMNINDPDSIVVYRNGDSERYGSSTDIYNNILDLVDKSYEQSALSALFTGSFNEGAYISTTSALISTTTGTYIKFTYDSDQTLMDGKDVYYKTSGTKITYDTLYLKIESDEDGFILCRVYIESQTTSGYSSYSYYVYADYTDLIDYVDDLSITVS